MIFIGLKLLYNVVLYSAVQQNESAVSTLLKKDVVMLTGNNNKNKQNYSNSFFPSFLSGSMILKTGKVRTNIVKRELNTRIDEEIVEST